MTNLAQFFSNPATPAQKQYEALRAIVVDKLPAEVVTELGTFFSLIQQLIF